MDHSIKRKIMRHRKMAKQKMSKQFTKDVHQSCLPRLDGVALHVMSIKSMQIVFVGLILCAASALAGPSSIQGIVNDAKGQPLKGVVVRLESKASKELFNVAK